MTKCTVKTNCKVTKDSCWYCDNYNLYQPKNINILSPRQEQQKLEYKLTKKVKKQTTASKRGKANRRNGRKAENELLKYLQSLHLTVHAVPASGAFKLTNAIKGYGDSEIAKRMSGDLKWDIGDKIYTIESKRDVSTDGLYKKAEDGPIHYIGFAYMLSQDLFEALINKVEFGDTIPKEPKGLKKIEKYFNQDNSDMVVISRPYLPRLFFIKEELYNEIKREETL